MRNGSSYRIVMGMFTFALIYLGYDMMYKEFTQTKAIGFILLCISLLILGIVNLIDILRKINRH